MSLELVLLIWLAALYLALFWDGTFNFARTRPQRAARKLIARVASGGSRAPVRRQSLPPEAGGGRTFYFDTLEMEWPQ